MRIVTVRCLAARAVEVPDNWKEGDIIKVSTCMAKLLVRLGLAEIVPARSTLPEVERAIAHRRRGRD